MISRANWTRQQLLVAFGLYCRMPFGQISSRHPDIIRAAAAIGRTPAALSMKMGNIASLDPAITSTGRRGLRAASAADRAMWDEMNADWESFAVESQRALLAIELAETTMDQAPLDYTGVPGGEDRTVQSTVRIGQGFFRAAVLSAYNERCCITGLAIPRLLEASHIVPWNHDRANRTNPQNGLLLSVLHHRAFDAGVITVGEHMEVRVATQYLSRGDEFFGKAIGRYQGSPIALPERFVPNRRFLAYHRENVFQG